jgi:hypothetical protein
MPAVDLARLKKQAARLADFFFVPDQFILQLHNTLDGYVNYSARKPQAQAPQASLRSYRTPSLVIQQIEQELAAKPDAYPEAALELADRLWDEAWLELRLLAAFLLGRIPPQEERLLARLTAWTGQTLDSSLRAKLLDSGLARMRKETPDRFFELVSEWLRPGRSRLWSNGLQAATSAIADPDFVNFPPLLKAVQPVLEAPPARLQLEIEEFVLAFYRISPTETTYFVRQVLINSTDPLTATTFRRISPAFPAKLKEDLKEFISAKPLSDV